MFKAMSPRNASAFWVRFWVPVLVSLGITPIVFCLGVAPAMSYGGTDFLMRILFPLAMVQQRWYPATTLNLLLIMALPQNPWVKS